MFEPKIECLNCITHLESVTWCGSVSVVRGGSNIRTVGQMGLVHQCQTPLLMWSQKPVIAHSSLTRLIFFPSKKTYVCTSNWPVVYISYSSYVAIIKVLMRDTLNIWNSFLHCKRGSLRICRATTKLGFISLLWSSVSSYTSYPYFVHEYMQNFPDNLLFKSPWWTSVSNFIIDWGRSTMFVNCPSRL